MDPKKKTIIYKSSIISTRRSKRPGVLNKKLLSIINTDPKKVLAIPNRWCLTQRFLHGISYDNLTDLFLVTGKNMLSQTWATGGLWLVGGGTYFDMLKNMFITLKIESKPTPCSWLILVPSETHSWILKMEKSGWQKVSWSQKPAFRGQSAVVHSIREKCIAAAMLVDDCIKK